MSTSLHQREAGGSRYVSGDTNPADFSWADYLTRTAYINMLMRNGKIRKACAWVAREAVRPRFLLKKDIKITSTKFGKPYTFDTTIEYLEWIEFFTELEKVFTWARCFGTAIIALFKDGEILSDQLTQIFEPLAKYDTCTAFYPIADGNGYELVTDRDKLYYQISITDNLQRVHNYKINADRVVVFNATQLELKAVGSSEVEPLMKLAIVQDQMLRSVLQRIQLMGAGVAVMSAANETEKATLAAAVNKSFTYLSKIWTTQPIDKVLQIVVPDIHPEQFKIFWDISQEEVATDMNMSKKLISGDPQGAISSAEWDTQISYTEVYQTQRHFKKAVEHVLFKLGLEETSFQWNDPFPNDISGTDAATPDAQSEDPKVNQPPKEENSNDPRPPTAQ